MHYNRDTQKTILKERECSRWSEGNGDRKEKKRERNRYRH